MTHLHQTGPLLVPGRAHFTVQPGAVRRQGPVSSAPARGPYPAGRKATTTGRVILPRLTRDRIALLAAIVGPLAVSAALTSVRHSLSNTDAALLLVAVVVAVAMVGHRVAGYLAAVSIAAWFDFFLTQP